MTINQILAGVSDKDAREHIERQYQSDIKILGQQEALEFARFRAQKAAEIIEEERDNLIQSYQAQSAALTWIVPLMAILAVFVGFIMGRAS
ncbi:hypothetical protein PL75_03395 [Neisseria arctica]|uniref:Uncharacterized protein n=1 Tax=Neisseria arctica TaxID=1470200 RepID=A0A0J0YT34_9NEIS|nr:hypothetical protein [Neisseria arctica]KLT73279.1 hypothetical protein PL75_03395 [Neisseria arctica]UOO87462.1 hypothetical protein LVJ86_04255 [Neisseria arctica]